MRACVCVCSSPGNFLPSLLKTGSRRRFNRLGEGAQAVFLISAWRWGARTGNRTAAEAPTRPTFLSTANPREHGWRILRWWSTPALEERISRGEPLPGASRPHRMGRAAAGCRPPTGPRSSHLYRRPLRRRESGRRGAWMKVINRMGQNMRKRRLFSPFQRRPPTSKDSSRTPVSFMLVIHDGKALLSCDGCSPVVINLMVVSKSSKISTSMWLITLLLLTGSCGH